MHFVLEKLPEDVRQMHLLNLVQKFNEDPKIHGILVQLPLPSHIDEGAVTEAVDVRKDVDGFHSANVGKLAKKDSTPSFVPCTPKGVLELIKSTGMDIEGKTAVVLGRSNTVGLPVSQLLQRENATVTVCHSKTANLKDIVKSADIIVAAIGKAQLIRGDWVKPGAVVIDVGINAIPGKTNSLDFRGAGWFIFFP